MRAGGGTVAFVRLECEREELVRRVQNESRRRHEKLTDSRVLLERYDLTVTLPFTPHLRLDTTRLSPAEAAARVAEHYALPRA